MRWLARAAMSAWLDRGGSVAIMTAVTVPFILLAMLGGTTVMKALSQHRELQSIAQAACNRAVKPQRFTIMEDADRRTLAETFFDQLAAERGLAVTERTVTAGWLEARVEASATIPIVPGLGKQVAINVDANEVCRGVPPYPTLNEVILSSNFKTPSGTSIDLPKYNLGVKWGVFGANEVGWDGGAGPGIEIQDWSKGFQAAEGVQYLPEGTSNPFVVELDSDYRAGGPAAGPAKACGSNGTNGTKKNYNSSMFKAFELHPGTYRFSLNHRSRIKNVDSTNCIEVYLEGTRPVTAKKLKLVMNDGDLTWKRRSFDIPVASYGLYRFHVEAAGCGDSTGGLFNDLKLEYIRRPTPEYNDPVPSPPTDTLSPVACPVF
jgi:Flp pilus assembly protein TadG